MNPLHEKYPGVKFYNSDLTEVQEDVFIGEGSRVGSMSILHSGARIGIGATIGSHCNICKCTIGNNVSIQTGCHITRGVTIEDDVFIGPGVITLNDKHMDGPMTYPYIEKGAKIGGGSIILPGVRIGAGATIGAGSVVTKDVPSNTTVFGNPAKAK